MRRVVAELEEGNYKGHRVAVNEKHVEMFVKGSVNGLTNIDENLSDRFSNFITDPIISAADIFDPSNWPNETSDEFQTYGKEEVSVMTTHFNDILKANDWNVDDVQREWTLFKVNVSRHNNKSTAQEICRKALSEKRHLYPNLCHLITIVMVTPVATAQVERQFSHLKRFLGDWRLGLTNETLECLLRIKTEGAEPVSFVSSKAVEHGVV